MNWRQLRPSSFRPAGIRRKALQFAAAAGRRLEHFGTTASSNGAVPEPEESAPAAVDAAAAGVTEAPEPRNRFPIGHYYSPMPDTRELEVDPRRAQVWPDIVVDPPGVDWREGDQLALCAAFASQPRLTFPEHATDDPTEYFSRNNMYEGLDAWVLEAMLRELRPRRMIEVGSGYSTLFSARINREVFDGQMHFTCIEPFPPPFLEREIKGLADLVRSPVQDTPLELFDELGENDVLFIDTSHVIKSGGDVPWLYHCVLPRLRPGVHVHIHDIFMPHEYPQQWVLEGWGWNEQYLLQSFLAFNYAFDVVFATAWMLLRHRDAMMAAFPGIALNPGGGGQIWLRRNHATVARGLVG